MFHPELPILLTCKSFAYDFGINNGVSIGAEDGIVKIWHANTYRHEMTLNYSKYIQNIRNEQLFLIRYGQSLGN